MLFPAHKPGKNLPLDTFLYGNILLFMPRAATTSDVFNAIAEPRRRELIHLLVNGKEHAVGDLVLRLRMPQPAVSKHLGVLRRVGVVTVNERGPLRLYRLNAKELKPVHDWVKSYERFWTHQLDRIRERAEQKMASQLANQLTKREERK
jgi:DNA-binding transcriptional ArsR family regulator